MSDRTVAREAFLAQAGYRPADADLLPADCSFRRYYRLRGQAPALLMDSPPPGEDINPFIDVAEHLAALGFSVPTIQAQDREQGFAVIEDFGDATYTRLLAAGADERALYELAVDVLVELHNKPGATKINVPAYDRQKLMDEAVLLPDWYMPYLTGQETSSDVRASYVAAWAEVMASMPEGPTVLVLRDFHVDNLMRLDGRAGVRACGLLDFQDAVIGHPAYDLMSLLEDARRDVDEGLQSDLRARYREGCSALDGAGFETWYVVLAAQRHAKVTGIFARQKLRDGKDVYLPHLPRVRRLMLNALRDPVLAPVAGWCEAHLPPAD